MNAEAGVCDRRWDVDAGGGAALFRIRISAAGIWDARPTPQRRDEMALCIIDCSLRRGDAANHVADCAIRYLTRWIFLVCRNGYESGVSDKKWPDPIT